MASEQQIKQYLAYWFQLGKKVLIRNGEQVLLPQPVFEGNSYSQDFERCWQLIVSPDSGDCYLEGTDETIAQLLTPAWDVTPCSRCAMPIPLRNAGMPPLACPCNDLAGWPNTDLPTPRSAVDSQERLTRIREQLLRVNS